MIIELLEIIYKPPFEVAQGCTEMSARGSSRPACQPAEGSQFLTLSSCSLSTGILRAAGIKQFGGTAQFPAAKEAAVVPLCDSLLLVPLTGAIQLHCCTVSD